MKTQNPETIHDIEFLPIGTSAVRTNSIFLDSADNALKLKNSNGEIQTL